ncbi:transposase family protein [Streptomyces sp. NPDC086010]|uniref:transposase family protein n=1 Tax=Streptomyces sp. NPDC086010 TaxID=3365745 RepID=UPI0037D022A9
MSRQSATVCLIKLHTRQRRAITDLPSWLGILIDPRDRRGRRHPFVSVLLTACSAVLTGEKSFGAIGQWASGAPPDALARLGARTATTYYVRVAPSAVTIGRIINAACPGGLADLLGDDLPRSVRRPARPQARQAPPRPQRRKKQRRGVPSPNRIKNMTLVADPHRKASLGEGGTSRTHRLFPNGWQTSRPHGHRTAPCGRGRANECRTTPDRRRQFGNGVALGLTEAWTDSKTNRIAATGRGPKQR